MQRAVLDRTPIALVATLVAALCLAGPAGATPAPTAPSGPSAAADRTGHATGPALRQAVARSAQSVLIVHVAGDARAVRAAAAAAEQGAASVRHTFTALNSFSVEVPAAAAPTEATRLEQLPGVSSVEAPVVRTFDAVTPDDPDLPREQAYLDAVHAPSVWARQHGSPAIRIAVVDSGVDVGHPDLAGKIVGQYNAVDKSANVTDQIGHGTFVSGVAAADTDNGIGVAGAGYDTDLLAVKIASADGSIQIDSEVAGIKWAADHGANIINLSLGGPDSSAAELTAVAYAQHKGVLVVAAAGNEGDTEKQYPAAYPGVVAVGATDPVHSARADFSSYGSWVTLAAPGVNIYSSVPRAGSQFWPLSQFPDGYANGDGTSFSTPLVAGEAALLLAQNPHLGAARLRAALIASAHGYSGRGLGAGQVDFALGLAHVNPTTQPSAVHVVGNAGQLRFVATSTAPAVRFRFGVAPALAPVRVSGGQASATFASWGYRNGTQTVYAYDCTAYGECAAAPARVTFTLANGRPTVTSPHTGQTVTGRFSVHVSNSGGGPVRLLISGKQVGLVRSAAYVFTASASALTAGHHMIVAQACSVDGRYCHGPLSAAAVVTAAGLHPRIHTVTPAQFSPNHDGVRDSTTVTFGLADPERVQIKFVNSAGTVVRSHLLGNLGVGAHHWTWSGTRVDGSRVPDGTYQVVLETAHGGRKGWVSHPVVVDTRAPSLSHPSGANALFYPYRDHYRDTFTTRTTLSSPGTLKLVIRSRTGKAVRTISANRHQGRAAISWTGFDAHGKRVPAGTYSWQLTLTDAAGNTTHTAHYPVRVSSKHLVHTTLDITRPGTKYDSAGGTASCAYVHKKGSAFSSGARLVNGCPMSGFDLAFGQYTFTVPAAVSYSTLALQALGRAGSVPVELTAAFESTDGTLEVPHYLKVKPGGTAWHTIASTPAAGEITSHLHVHVTVLLDSTYAGVNVFDISGVRLRVHAVVLR